jgi:hypothetical protein
MDIKASEELPSPKQANKNISDNTESKLTFQSISKMQVLNEQYTDQLTWALEQQHRELGIHISQMKFDVQNSIKPFLQAVFDQLGTPQRPTSSKQCTRWQMLFRR